MSNQLLYFWPEELT